MREEADGRKIWAGEFQLDPAKPAKRQGELHYHPSQKFELRLQVFDHNAFYEEQKDYPVIVGTLEGMQEVSLFDCFDSGGHIKLGYRYQEIMVNYALIGKA